MAPHPTTIRAQMVFAIGSIVLAVIVVLVFVTLFVAQHQLYELGERDVKDRVEAIAARAGFAVIVGADSPDVAKQLASESTGVNGILATELTGADGGRLASLEESANLLDACQYDTNHVDTAGATTSKRVNGIWCVAAPIFKRTNMGVCTASNCIVGHLHVVATTASVAAVVRRLIGAILFMGAVLLAFALFFLWTVSAKISSPLRDIVLVMRRFAAGERDARADEHGPEEAMTISRVYNELIEAQEEQSRNLENTVEQRTQQLTEATLKAQDAERYKTIFMAHISHDMRTPLHVIRTQATDIMNELEFGGSPERARPHVEVIIHQSTELAYRVQQVLELTRGDSGHGNLQLAPLSIDDLRGELLDKADALAKQRRNKLVILADIGSIWTDADKVLQIATNLIENACKFTTAGTVEVSLKLQSDIFRIAVTDSGVGIPNDQIAHIWSEFRQAQLNDGRRIGGFGLGLAIVRQYTTMLGGQYGAESEEGHGATVWVELPAKVSAADEVRA